MADTKTDIIPSIIEGIQERKGKEITIVDLTEILSAPTRTFIICQGSSTMHVSSIADSIREYVQQHTDRKPYNYDGYRNSQWIVLDYGEVMVHIFVPDIREHYNLEQLWADAPQTKIPDLD